MTLSRIQPTANWTSFECSIHANHNGANPSLVYRIAGKIGGQKIWRIALEVEKTKIWRNLNLENSYRLA